jgi:hypothetical protein
MPNKREGVVYIFYSSSPFISIPIINIEVRFGNKKREGEPLVVCLPFFRCITALKTYTVLQKTYF